MTSTKNYIAIILLTMLSWSAQAQSEIQSYDLKKGQAFDIIFLNTKPATEDLKKKYFESAYPIALGMGYTPLTGFGVSESPLQGNYHPEVMVFGTWPSIQARKQFLVDIGTTMPNFHAMRRDIWSTFFLTYWEVKEDVSFKINPEKYNVVTSYWSNDGSSFGDFKKTWLKALKKSKGENIIELTDGDSPFGYDYNPDYMVITQWDSKAAYDDFYKKSIKLDRSAIKQVHQLAI